VNFLAKLLPLAVSLNKSMAILSASMVVLPGGGLLIPLPTARRAPGFSAKIPLAKFVVIIHDLVA
jgi:hypothetical protein